MIRQEIIEQAKNYLPSFEYYKKPSIIIKIIDIDESEISDVEVQKPGRNPHLASNILEIEFLSCYVSDSGIKLANPQETNEKHELMWIPKEQLDSRSIRWLSDY